MNYIKLSDNVVLEMDFVKVKPGTLFKSTKVVGRLINMYTSVDLSEENINRVIYYKRKEEMDKMEDVIKDTLRFDIFRRTEMGTHAQVSVPKNTQVLTTMPEGKWFIYND